MVISVLYVDDEPDFLFLGKKFLDNEPDMIVDTMTSAGQALETLKTRTYDAIVSDYLMPAMDGIQFLQKVRSLYGSVPFILFTGKGREEVVITALNSGADYYLQKGGDAPSQFAELAHNIRLAVERKRAGDLLVESDRRFRKTLQNMKLVAFQLDNDGKVLFCNDHLLHLTGWSREELMDQDFFEMAVPAYLREKKKRLFQEAMRKGTISQHEEMKLLLRNGEVLDIDVMNTDLRDEHGKLFGYMCIGDDVTERNAARKEIKAWRNRYKMVTTSSGLVVYDYDRKNDRIIMSENVRDVFGYEYEQINQGFFQWISFVHPHDRQSTLDAFESLNKSRNGVIKYRFRHADGHYIWVEDKVFVTDYQNTFRLIGIMADITRQQEAEEALRVSEAKLRTANNKLSLLSSITRHDISNSVHAMQGFFALMDEYEQDEIGFFIKKLNEIGRSIESQMKFSHEYEKVGVLEPEWFEIRELLEKLSFEDIHLIYDFSSSLEIYADPMISKVFYNLLTNAKNHGKIVSSITVSSHYSEDGLVLSWEDDGIGIPIEEKEKIFKYGYGKNTGYGLYLISEILRITSITITETGIPGKGARFEILIPHDGYRSTNESNKKAIPNVL